MFFFQKGRLQIVFFCGRVLNLLVRNIQGFFGKIESLVEGILRLHEFLGQLIELLLEQIVFVQCALLISEVGLRILFEIDLSLLEGHLFFYGDFKLFSELLDLGHVSLAEVFQLF